MRSSKTIQECIDRINADHFPSPPAPPAKMAEIVSSLPWPIPGDLRLFYEKCNGARLFRDDDSPCEIVPIEEFHSTRIDITGEDNEKRGPAAWFSIAYVQDTNYIAIDLSSVSHDLADILDCFHETFGIEGYQLVIAKSFTEFLSDVIDSGGRQYWLDKEFTGYGYR
jgi:SMI1 / KNR4 family (SUKH-1)